MGGFIRACKFSFRGKILDPAHATGWIWTELTGLSWRDRAADVVMLGAAFYNRQIAVEQLYLKQKGNQLTLIGETPMPANFSDWINLDFRFDLSATIVDLADFATLFGANVDEFSGGLSVAATLNAHDRKFNGHVSAEGSALRIFNAPMDLFRTQIILSGAQLNLDELLIARGKDFLHAQGRVDLRPHRTANGTLRFSIRDLADYSAALPALSLAAGINFDGRAASIDAIELQDGAVNATFSGFIDFADIQDVRISLTPAEPLLDIGLLRNSDCIGAVQLLRTTAPQKFQPEIQRIDLRGSATGRDWNVTLEKDAGPNETISLCRDPAGRKLQLLVAGKAEREFGARALRSFHRAVSKPLSLSLDRQ